MESDVKEDIAILRKKILEDIGDIVSEINGRRPSYPIAVRGVVVTDNSIMTNGKLELMCIYDEEGDLCADFKSKNDLLGKGFVLGRKIASLHLEDLAGILGELTRINRGRNFKELNVHNLDSMKKSLMRKNYGDLAVQKGA